jgi:hypothetical protein
VAGQARTRTCRRAVGSVVRATGVRLARHGSRVTERCCKDSQK